MPASDFYRVIRSQIEHVVNSRNQRIIWLVIAQSFFFSGFAILVTGNPGAPDMKDKQHLLLMIFPAAALLTVIFTFIDVICSQRHVSDLCKIYEKKNVHEDM